MDRGARGEGKSSRSPNLEMRTLFALSWASGLGALAFRFPRIVDFICVGQLGLAFVDGMALIAFILIPFQIVSSVATHSIQVLLHKERDSGTRKSLVQSAKSSVFVSALVLASGLIWLGLDFGRFDKWLPTIENAELATMIVIATGALFLINQFMLRVLLAVGHMRTVIVTESCGLIFNLLIKSIASYYLRGPNQIFLGILIATAVSQLMISGIYLERTSREFGWGFTQVRTYLGRAKSLISGEFFVSILVMCEPLIFAMCLKSILGTSAAFAAYNVGFVVASSLAVTVFQSLAYGGVAFLASVWESRGTKIWESRVATIHRLAIIAALPAIAVSLSAPLWAGPLFGVSGVQSGLIVAMVILGMTVSGFASHLVCELRTFEAPKWIGLSGLLTSYGIGLPLLALLAWMEMPVAAVFAGVVLPSLFRYLALKHRSEKAQASRRSEVRVAIDETFGVRFKFTASDRSSIEHRCVVRDISRRGCSFDWPKELDIGIGSRIEGHIVFPNGESLVVNSVLRSVRKTSATFPWSKKDLRAGVQFETVQTEVIEKVIGDVSARAA